MSLLWTPKEIQTELWLDASDQSTIVLDVNNKVERWIDKSGNYRYATESTLNIPSYQSNILNSFGAVSFDGNKYIGGNFNVSLTEESTFVIFRFNSSSKSYARVFTQSDATNDYQTSNKYIPIVRQNLDNVFGSETSSTWASLNVPLNTFVQFSSIHSGQVLINRLNGGSSTNQVNNVWSKTFTRYRLGGALTGTPTSDGLSGEICEVIVISYEVDNTTREKIEGYLAHKWGLTASLPSDHQYKLSSPKIYVTDGLISYYPLNIDVSDAHHNKNDGELINGTLVEGKNVSCSSLNGVNSELVIPISAWNTISCWFSSVDDVWDNYVMTSSKYYVNAIEYNHNIMFFDGVNDYIIINDSNRLRVSGDLTIECIIRTGLTTECNLLSKYDHLVEKRSYVLSISHPNVTAGRLYFNISSTNEVYTGVSVSSSIVVNDNVLHHIAAVFKAGEYIKIYVDGVDRTADQIGEIQNSIAVNDKKVAIGAHFNGTDVPVHKFYNGHMSDVRIWNVARSDADILLSMKRRMLGNEVGLVGYWRLDEGTGSTVYDLTNNSNNGTIVGPVPVNIPFLLPFLEHFDYMSYVPGDKWGLKFDGVDDYISLGSPNELKIDGTITLEIWLLINNLNNYYMFWGNYHSSTSDSGNFGGVTTDGSLKFDGRNKTGAYKNFSSGINLIEEKKWYHVAVTSDGVNWIMYLNGNEVANEPYGVLAWDDTNIKYIGREPAAGENWGGLIKEVRIWNTARTQQQIQENMYSPLNGNETGLVAYYKFDEKSGTTLTDYASTNNGTINGATWAPLEFDIVFGRKSYRRFSGSNHIEFTDFYNSNSTNSIFLGTSPSHIDNWNGNCTYIAIVRPTTVDSTRRSVFTDNNYNEGDISFYSNKIYSYWGDGNEITYTTSVYTNRWYYVAISHERNDSTGQYILKLYVNGVLRGTSSRVISGSPDHYGPEVTMILGYQFHGDIHNVQIYDSVLSLEEINSCFGQKNPILNDNLVFYLPMSEGSGSYVYDLVGGRHGVVNGGSWQNEYDEFKIDELYIGELELSAGSVDGLYNNGTGLFYNDLFPYTNRIKITIDHTKLSEDLVHFPVLIKLGVGVGIDDQDLSDIFDFLSAGNKKLAVISNNIQLYVEIEQWDVVNKKAVLWVSRDIWTISSEEDTDIWLYFGGNVDNTDYVADYGSRPEVWNSKYIGVWHQNGTSTNTMYDSTSNENNGTKSGTFGSDEVDGLIGGSQYFNGINSVVNTSPSVVPTNSFVFQALVKARNTHQIDTESNSGTGGISGQYYVFSPDHMGTDGGAGLSVGTNGISVYEHGNSYLPALAVYSSDIGEDWNHILISYEEKQPNIYLNGNLVRTGYTSTKSTVYAPRHIGGDSYGYFEGDIDEVRITNESLTSSYISFDKHVQFDEVLTFGDIEAFGSDEPYVLLNTPTVSGVNVELNALLLSIGTSEVVEYYFQYKKSDSEIWLRTTTEYLVGLGDFSRNVILEYNTVYDLRCVYSWTDEYDNKITKTTSSIQFITDADPNSITKSVEHVEITFNSGELSSSIPLTKFQNILNCVPFVSCTSNQELFYRFLADVYFENDPINGPTLVVERGQSTGITTYSIYIVEFNPTVVKVQQGVFDVSTVTTQTLSVDNIVKNSSAILGYWKTTDSTRYSARHLVRCSIESDTQIQFYRNNTTGNCTGHWFLFESLNNSFSVNHIQLSHTGTYYLYLDEPVDLLNSFILNSYAINNNTIHYNPKSMTVVGFFRCDFRLIYYNTYASYTNYHHTQIITFNDDKIHVPYQMLFSSNTSGDLGFDYTNQYSDDRSLTCNLDNSVVFCSNTYGLNTYDETYSTNYIHTLVKFKSQTEVIITTLSTTVRSTINVVSWGGINVEHTKREKSSNSLVESVEKYYMDFSSPPLTKVSMSLSVFFLTNKQDYKYCLPIVSMSCNSSSDTSYYERDSLYVIRRSNCFIVISGISSVTSTAISLELIEFSANRFKEIQYIPTRVTGTSYNLPIEEIKLENTFCKFYMYSGETNMNPARHRISFDYLSNTEMVFYTHSSASARCLTIYIVESIEDEIVVSHKHISSMTGGNTWIDNNGILGPHHFELLSHTFDYDNQNYFAPSVIYKVYSSYPYGSLNRTSTVNTIREIQLEQVRFNDDRVKIFSIFVNIGHLVNSIEYILPFSVNKHNSVCIISHQQNLSCWNDTGSSINYQTDSFFTCRLTDHNKVLVERKKSYGNMRNFINIIEFPPPNKYFVSGTVEEDVSGFVERSVSMFRSSDHKLTDTTMSNSEDGTFYLESDYDGVHYVVCNDDVPPINYNDLVYGKIVPEEITPIIYFTTEVIIYGGGETNPPATYDTEHSFDSIIEFITSSGIALDFFIADGTEYTSELEDPILSHTFYNVKETHEVEITFTELVQVYVTITGNGEGTVSPDGIVDVIKGRDKTFYFYPVGESALNRIEIDGVPVDGPFNYYTIENITTDITLEVVYTSGYVVTIESLGNGTGNIISEESPYGVISGGSTYIEFIPTNGSIVEQIIVNGVITFNPGRDILIENIIEDTLVQIYFISTTIIPEIQLGSDELLSGSKRISVIDTTSIKYGDHIGLGADEILDGSTREV